MVLTSKSSAGPGRSAMRALRGPKMSSGTVLPAPGGTGIDVDGLAERGEERERGKRGEREGLVS